MTPSALSTALTLIQVFLSAHVRNANLEALIILNLFVEENLQRHNIADFTRYVFLLFRMRVSSCFTSFQVQAEVSEENCNKLKPAKGDYVCAP